MKRSDLQIIKPWRAYPELDFKFLKKQLKKSTNYACAPFFHSARPVTMERFFSQVYVRTTDMYIAVSVAESREKFNIISISHHLHQKAYTSKSLL
ncbi:MAG TPA: hypothetical protein VN843_16085 [Anaerolineales bacterium]|nr:hypothetical protein [Anaerolineales bacterium]